VIASAGGAASSGRSGCGVEREREQDRRQRQRDRAMQSVAIHGCLSFVLVH